MRLMVAAVLLAGALLIGCRGEEFFDLTDGEPGHLDAQTPDMPLQRGLAKDWAVDAPRQVPRRHGPLPGDPWPIFRPAAAPSPYQAALELHNSLRATHQAPPLIWNISLAAQTAAYAANCTWAHGSFGENMYLTSNTNNISGAVTDAVARWYDEVVNYNFTMPGFSPSTGHFTQVVWKSSTQLGCAAQVCADGIKGSKMPSGTLVICRYLPYGNVQGQFARNVFPPVAPAPAIFVSTGRALQSPDCYTSANRRYLLCMRREGRLMLLNNTRNGQITLWSSTKLARLSAGSYPVHATLGTDGSFKVWDAKNRSLWSSNTANLGEKPHRLALRDDGNLLLLDANNVPVWQTRTAAVTERPTTSQLDDQPGASEEAVQTGV